MNKALTLFSIFFLLFGCINKKFNKNESNVVYSEKENDSIINILNNLCGHWDIKDKLKQKHFVQGISFGVTQIECVYNIENEKYKLINQISITEPFVINREDSIFPNSIDSLFLATSDSVKISKKEDHFGFEYYNKKYTRFIPIEVLNDTVLELVDGREYFKVKN
ncbi:hypothetical protein [Mesonia sp. K7]|uniref:hypothetical protein n=1 Tax=Mesonia sp. K7 TaxID=2218606 RepID=UPI000DAA96CE|nr:hypothetical protein [Mesonia sp. K7]PZD79468.1 hypothetical protein DNG35_00205 [Mesonia sp. K7]